MLKKTVLLIILIILAVNIFQVIEKSTYRNEQETKTKLLSVKTIKTKPTKWWMKFDAVQKMIDDHQSFFLERFWAGMTEIEFLNVMRYSSNDIAIVDPNTESKDFLYDGYISVNKYKKSFSDKTWTMRSPTFLRIFKEIPYLIFSFQKDDKIGSNIRRLASVSINVDSDNKNEYDSIRKLFKLKYRQLPRTRFDIINNSYSFEAKNVNIRLTIRNCETNEYCRVLNHQNNYLYHININYSDKFYSKTMNSNRLIKDRIADSIRRAKIMQDQDEFLQKF